MQLTETKNAFILGIISEIDSRDIKIERAWEILESANAARHLGTKLFNYVKDRCIEIAQNQLELDFEQALQVVADKVVQFEFNLGVKWPEEKPNLNIGLGKGSAIISIEGIRQEFDMWRRKAEVEKWGTVERKKACELLRPMVEFYDYLLSTEGGVK
jgi:hypothetical protein